MVWSTIRTYVASKPVVFMNTSTSYTYDSDLMPGCAVTAQGMTCPTASNVVKVIPSSLVSGTVAPASNVIHVTSPMVAQPTMIQG
mmetsp:Transcript_3324/g.8028  ORF Transcript_3324/g.8028 Transcript_3324/m.8028 type:complete len:85 (+) Transcript_3324:30-284(+)